MERVTTARRFDRKPCLLCMVHLPPPINGVTLMGEQVISLDELRSRFDIRAIPLNSSDSIADIGKLRPGKLLRMVSLALRLSWRCMKDRPDLIYFTLTPNGKAFYRDLLYVGIMKLFGIRRIYHLHGKGVAEAMAGPFAKRLYSWAFRGADVILLSPILYEDSAQVVQRERCHFLPNGIPDPWGREETIGRKGQEGAPPRILYFSNLVVNKGLFVMLESLVLLRERGLAFRAVFAGVWESAAVEGAFHRCVQENGLLDVIEVCGPQYGDDKRRTYAAADIMAFPTYNDAYPLVVLEAMSHGLPVVSTYEGAIPDMVVEGESGFLVPRLDPHTLADRLALLLTEPALRIRMGSAGRARYRAFFTMDIFTNNLLVILETCLGNATTRFTNGCAPTNKGVTINS